MKALFIADLQLNENEGIYKKILAQAKGIANCVGECALITKKNKKSKIQFALKNEIAEVDLRILDNAINLIRNENLELIYIRHMIPKFKLIKLLKIANKKNIKVYYEIPTYPYFAEQIRSSRKKYRAICKVFLDIIFLPIIYKYVYKMVVIKSNTKVKKYKKMFEINNGACVENIKEKKYYQGVKNVEKFSMVTVGTLYPYHGYDRILKGLKKCNEKVDDKEVEFNIIGESQTIQDLKVEVEKLNLKNVKFLGVKNVDELNELFDNYDVGLGCMALHRRNANIDTTIKVIEYFCRGMIVVSSGITPMDTYNEKYTIHVEDTETPIDIEYIYKKYKEISLSEKKEISKISKEKFSWNNIMRTIIYGG